MAPPHPSPLPLFHLLLLLTLPSSALDINIGTGGSGSGWGGGSGGGYGYGYGSGSGGGGGEGGGHNPYYMPPPPRCKEKPCGPPPTSWCRPLPTPYDPEPCDFENEKQYKAYLVIQKFKRTITCDPKGITRNWVGTKVCNYTGFYCDDPPNAKGISTIAAVDFNGYQLDAPTVGGFIDDLPDLAFFHANTNNFSGTVPDLSKLPFIYELDFSNNKLTGPYPSATTNIKDLLFLDIRYNSLSGEVDPSVFDVDLEVLFLNNNNFKGMIPANLGCTTAKYLTLANNKFTGPIPSSIGQTKDTLVEVVLLNNKLTGCLPYEIGLLEKATVFDAGRNLLSGEIPYSFACLGKIEELNLASNKLFGDIPDVVCKLPNLLNLSLSDNYFTSLGHSCHKLLKKGILDVRNNCIPHLPNQRSGEECYKFSCERVTCPVTPYRFKIPCKAPWCGHGYVPPMTESKRSSIAPSPAYTAVQKPQS